MEPDHGGPGAGGLPRPGRGLFLRQRHQDQGWGLVSPGLRYRPLRHHDHLEKGPGAAAPAPGSGGHAHDRFHGQSSPEPGAHHPGHGHFHDTGRLHGAPSPAPQSEALPGHP